MKKQKAKVIKLVPKNKAVVDGNPDIGRYVYQSSEARVIPFYSKQALGDAKELRDACIKLGHSWAPIEEYL